MTGRTAAQAVGRPDRHRLVAGRRGHGRRAGQREARRIDDDRDGRERRAGPVCVSGATGWSRAPTRFAFARPDTTLEGPASVGRRRRPHGATRSEAAQDAGPGGAADQRRVVHELARHDGDEERPAQLHAVPHARARRAQQAHRRRVDEGARAHGTLLAGQHARASAAAAERARRRREQPDPAAEHGRPRRRGSGR